MIAFVFAENSIQLVPDGTLFLHIIIILGMVFVLNATLFKPINRILEKREGSTRGRSGEAREIMQSVDEKVSRYENALREARSEGYRLMEQERNAAMVERQSKLETARGDLSKLIENQTDAIRTQADAARVTLQEDSRRLASEIGAQILHRPVG
jgi:F0F1-type ATP synthase membrane subunit b/b'